MKKTDSRDHYKDYSDPSLIPKSQAADRLSMDFRNVSIFFLSSGSFSVGCRSAEY